MASLLDAPRSVARDLAVLVTLNRTNARAIARRTGLPYWRVARIIAGRAEPRDDEAGQILAAIYDEQVPA